MNCIAAGIEPALRQLELTWYEQLVAARGRADDQAYRVTSSMVSAVATAARENNRTVMEQGGAGWA